MKKQRTSIDGFKPRRPSDKLGNINNNSTFSMSERNILLGDRNNENKKYLTLEKQQTRRTIGRSDIDESLHDIDKAIVPIKKLSRKQRQHIKKMSKKPRSRARRIVRRIVITLIIAVLAFLGYAAIKFIITGNNIFQGNMFDIFQNQPLKQDSRGRSNFLILGTSEDNIGHNGADLTDSMLIISVDQKKKNVYMFSVPRDLYVDYGQACVAGYSGKINAYFSCAETGSTKEAEQKRLKLTQAFIGEIFGLDIQYGIHVNHTVIKEVVDAVGGIDVDIKGSNGASGILDRNFDWRCKYSCYLVKYDNGIHHLDGEHALFLSQARGDVAPTYGLGNSNFDREKNQQKILIALKDKAMDTGTLTDINAVTKLLDSFGNNLRTNIQTNEIRTLMQVTSEIKSKNVYTLSLVGDDNSVVKTGNYGGASVVIPIAGIFDYSEIKSFIDKNLNPDPVVKESAPIVVLNGTNQTGYAKTKADSLSEDGFNVSLVDNAPDGKYEKVEIYQIGSGNIKIASKLASIFKVDIKKSSPPTTVNGNVRFVIIFGDTTG